MKSAKLFFLLSSFIMFFSCSSDEAPVQDRKAAAQQKLNAATAGFPGLSLSVRTPNEAYTIVAGDAVIGTTPMAEGTLHYMQSISKTFTAVAILRLKEQGLINLNAPISSYLPQSICSNLANGNTITVRQLLNMTSGLPDYLDNDQFITDVLTGPLPMPSSQVLGYVYNQPAHFAPGSSFGYSNINYHLLALIIDSVTPNGHREYITNNVINAAGLSQTYYIAGSASAAAPSGTTASYLANGNSFQDVSDLQLGTVRTAIGDDGIVATTQDIALFYHKLLHEEALLSAGSLAEMKTTVSYQGQPIYGLGLHFYRTAGGLQAIGHDGSGAGAGAYAFYFPAKDMTIVLSTNTGTLSDAAKEQELLNLWTSVATLLLM